MLICIRNSSHIHSGILAGAVQLCTTVGFSPFEEDWVVCSALAEETEALLKQRKCYEIAVQVL